MKISILFALMLLTLSSLNAQDKNIELKSPDGEVVITFKVVETAVQEGQNRRNEQNRPMEARLTYEVSYRGKLLMEPSAMGLELQGSRPLGQDVETVK
ncbi:MAG: glycoside hydrolase family 97 N-terminal domain-containing protein, partial [Tannerella sp.]|nr:glycoside hydrolase family 97 N-terminal domain-containing protein [Tannerella sp.]